MAAPSEVEAGILREYRRLWQSLIPAAAAAVPADRRGILEPVLADPALSEWLAFLIKLDRAGQRSVGRAVPLEEVIQRRGDTAVVTGCLDSSHVALVDKKSSTFISRGEAREVAVVTFRVSADGKWRVTGTNFRKDLRC